MDNTEFNKIVEDIMNNPRYAGKLTREQVEDIVRDELSSGSHKGFSDEAVSSANIQFRRVENTGYQNRKSHPKISVIIVSYEQYELTKDCLDSIAAHCNAEDIEVIVIDNASSDGSDQWLCDHVNDYPFAMLLLLMEKNAGFPGGCNVGIRAASPRSDIFLLNNDTRLLHNSLSFLQKALCRSPLIGAVGAVSNYGSNDTVVNYTVASVEEYIEYGNSINIPTLNPIEEKSILSAFAMLIKRDVLEQIRYIITDDNGIEIPERTEYFDEQFFPGYFDDNDLCLRIRLQGYRLMLVHNSYIYHAGSKSFRQFDLEPINERNHLSFIRKWNYDCRIWQETSDSETEVQKQIEELLKERYPSQTDPKDMHFRLIEIGAGTGDFISRLKYKYPNAFIIGAESDETAVSFSLDSATVLFLENNDRLPFPRRSFDFIIIKNRDSDSVLNSHMMMEKYGSYLLPGGQIFPA
ncbi:MAG: glycosyltransferase [Lachnospiraceae bacterium]|nr:glycosyltransferase [Lachnospiraceae bacterium]